MSAAASSDGPPGIDLVRIRRHLAAVLDHGPVGPLTAEVIAGGRSNVTYRVTDGTTVWVVRRPPLGGVLATAHDVAREARVMHALAGTAVPVPPVLHLCEDSDVIGAPFVVMAYVDGVVLQSLRYCDTHGYEVPSIKDYLGSIGIPSIYIEHDNTEGALAQIRTRVQGFLEVIG